MTAPPINGHAIREQQRLVLKDRDLGMIVRHRQLAATWNVWLTMVWTGRGLDDVIPIHRVVTQRIFNGPGGSTNPRRNINPSVAVWEFRSRADDAESAFEQLTVDDVVGAEEDRASP